MSKDIVVNIKELVRKYSLENAVKHHGKANEKSIMQKIMATHPELRKEAQKIQIELERTLSDINSLELEKQIEQLQIVAPELLEKKGHGKREYDLPPLTNAIIGEVVTRYAPAPNGDMHLGHGFTAYFAAYYAKKYQGEFILRFEDTNPKQDKLEFMDAHKEALAWLGLKPDKEVIVSNDIPIFYEKAVALIKSNSAYTCSCDVDYMRALRAKMQLCIHAKKSPEETLNDWEEMMSGKYNDGEMVLRLRGEMENQNAVMRDPAIFSIRKSKHCIQGAKYLVWPLYDFAVAIEDNLCGITHIARSAEFDTRIELQNRIRELLGLIPHPRIFHHARFNVTGSPASKRLITPLVKEGKVDGWDDIRLVTIKGLKRRGILPETIKKIALEIGMTTQPVNIDWSLISATNRKLIDSQANRYFFIDDPVLLYIKNISEERTCNVPFHPDHPMRGVKTIKTGNLFLITKTDYNAITENSNFRLKDLYNVKCISKNVDLIKENVPLIYSSKALFKKYKTQAIGEYTGEKITTGLKIQWVPAKEYEFIPVEVKIPGILIIDGKYNEHSLTKISGVAEKAFAKLSVDDIVQFERFGFVRIDQKDQEKIYVNMSHK